MKILKKVLYLLSSSERKNVILLIIGIFFVSFLDMIGVASILPFMTVLVNPDIIQTNFILKEIFVFADIFGVNNEEQFIVALGIIFLVLFITSLLFKALMTYAQARFILMREYSISKRLIENYLKHPYGWFLNQNSADLSKTILSEVSLVTGRALRPIMDLISKGMVVLLIVFLLITVNPKVTLIISTVLCLAYGALFFFFRDYLNKIGAKRLKSNELRYLSLSEILGSIKELKLMGMEKFFIKRFSNPAHTFARTSVVLDIISQLPRFALEGILFGTIISIFLYLITQTEGGFNDALPIISLYAFAGYRLFPAIQHIYVSLTKLAFIGPSVDEMVNDFKDSTKYNLDQNQSPIELSESIVLKDLSFSYLDSSRSALRNINIAIPAKKKIGIIGHSGSGKTTLVDIILGLLEPKKGILKIDNKIISKNNIRSWQKSIGYVPQNIYLFDDTISANIAFHYDQNKINQENVEKAAKIANIHDFIMTELPKKYNTVIGEHGARLSGGQRQRIGVARALYHNPKLIILDEATSALDNDTEKKVMEMIENLPDDITILIIAHRLTTIKKCEFVIELKNGEIKSVEKNQHK